MYYYSLFLFFPQVDPYFHTSENSISLFWTYQVDLVEFNDTTQYEEYNSHKSVKLSTVFSISFADNSAPTEWSFGL